MAVGQLEATSRIDSPPLWLPRHEQEVVAQASARPPDAVQGYRLRSHLTAAIFGSPWKVASSVALLVAVLMDLLLLPTLLRNGGGSVVKLTIYQAWTLGLMLWVTARVRSVSIASAARHWLAGLFAVSMAVHFLSGPLGGLLDNAQVWIIAPLEQLLKVLPLVVAVYMGRRNWRHPGLSDLMILGFAVGAGYGMHVAALWGGTGADGFELGPGLLVPIINQEGMVIAGHAVWTAVAGFGLGLLLLHRHQPAGLVGGVTILAMTVVDYMVIGDGGTLDVARKLLFDGVLVVLVFFIVLAVAVVLDLRRQEQMASRDHLFPSDRSRSARLVDPSGGDDLMLPLLAARYRRLRNGMHNTADAVQNQWPPHSESHPAPIAELARHGRAAGVAVGPGTSSSGWAPDPTSTGLRFVGSDGFTAFAAVDDLHPAATSAVSMAGGATYEPTGVAGRRTGDYWQFVALGGVAVGLFVLVRLLTAGDPFAGVVDLGYSAAMAPQSPALIRCVIGSLAAAVAIRGRNMALIGHGAEVGPLDDPVPPQPDECEA